MVIDSKYPNEGFVSRSVSSELIASDELIVDIDGFEGPLAVSYTHLRAHETV